MFSSNRSTNTTMMCEFKLKTPEWPKSMTKILNRIKGGRLLIYADERVARVTGQGNLKKLLKLMGSKKGKDTEMSFVTTGTDYYPQPNHRYHHHHHHRDYNFNYNGYQNPHFGQSSTPYWSEYYYAPAPGMQTYHYQQNPYSGGYNNYGYYN